MDWQITECDINRDIKLSHLLHFSAIKIQVKYLDHLFRIYIKSMGKETVCRVEESLHPKKSALETINNIFNPMEKVERQIAALNTKISAIYDIVSKPRTTPTAKDSKHECCCSGLPIIKHSYQLTNFMLIANIVSGKERMAIRYSVTKIRKTNMTIRLS